MKEIVIANIAKDLPKSKTKELEKVLSPMLGQLKGMEIECNSIVAKEISPEVCQEAKSLRLKMVKNRTALDKERKKLKADIILQGNAIQSVYNLYLSVAKPLESALEAKEKYYELIEQQKKKDLALKRAEILKNAGVENELIGVDLGELDDDSWINLFNGQKALVDQKRAREAEEAAAEEAEKAKNKLYTNRRESIIKYSRFPLFDTLTVDTTEADFLTLVEALKMLDAEDQEKKKKYDKLLDRQAELGSLRIYPAALNLTVDTTDEEYEVIKSDCQKEMEEATKEALKLKSLEAEKAEKAKTEKELLEAGDRAILDQAIIYLDNLCENLESSKSITKIRAAKEALR